MQNKIVFENMAFDLADLPTNNRIHRADATREWRQLRVVGAYADIAAAFVDNAEYRREYESQRETDTGAVDADGNPIYETVVETHTEDLSEYSIAGDIVDHRDGIITVFMGKPTEAETLRELLQAANQAISGEISAEEYQATAIAKGESALASEIGISKAKS